MKWILGTCLLLTFMAGAQAWEPAATSPLLTQWAGEVDPAEPLPEYPRPQMARKIWTPLNGLWDYAIRPLDEDAPAEFDGEILVPYPLESALSGVGKRIGSEERLWYHRAFDTPALRTGGRLLLHFGAVDWHAQVWINGVKQGEHKGGYTPFSFDITDALRDEGQQEIVVSVWDETSKGTQPRGKQINKPGGIWYTPVTGIWQTVWLEPVPGASIRGIKTVANIDEAKLYVDVTGVAGKTDRVRVVVKRGPRTVTVATDFAFKKTLTLPINNMTLWSPENPHLYGLDNRMIMLHFNRRA